MQSSTSLDSADPNIVEIWLRKDPIRWAAGIMAGAFAGVVMMAFAMMLYKVLGYELWFPIKVGALPILGGAATELGNMKGVAVGFITIEVICSFLGFVYAHFTGTNSLPALLGAGLTWGAFSWIFINNLFTPAFRAITAAHLPRGPAFAVCMVFGLSLTSVAFFDRALRGNRT